MSDFLLPEAGDTVRFGASLGRACPWSAGEPRSLGLRGELGAGKTTLAQGLLAALGVTDPVRSPSYTLIEIYVLATRRAVHVDLYRLRAAEELENLGLRDELRGDTLLLLEWPERAGGLLPADLTVTLTIPDAARDRRYASLLAHSSAGRNWMNELQF